MRGIFDTSGRKLEEKQKLARLVRFVIWCQEETGKPYPEIIRMLLYKRRSDLPDILTLTSN